jgi:hypothetical protein
MWRGMLSESIHDRKHTYKVWFWYEWFTYFFLRHEVVNFLWNCQKSSKLRSYFRKRYHWLRRTKYDVMMVEQVQIQVAVYFFFFFLRIFVDYVYYLDLYLNYPKKFVFSTFFCLDDCQLSPVLWLIYFHEMKTKDIFTRYQVTFTW